MTAPNQNERKVCWEARDEYWKCLDGNNGDRTKCQDLKKNFEGKCSKTWAKYFERRYDYLKFKARMEKEGYEPVNKET